MKSNQMNVSTRITSSKRLSSALLAGALLAGLLGMTACKCPFAGQKTPAFQPIRINAGAEKPYVAPDGSIWLPDQGFTGGKIADRGTIEIAGTKLPDLYRTEHYGMTAFTLPVPNGTYTVKLHFAETYARITEKGQRVFGLKVAGVEIKDLDIVARAGAAKTAFVETVPVTITDGKLDILFTAGVQNPLINAIEVQAR